MKRLLAALTLICLLFISARPAAADVQNFKIESFTADYVLTRSPEKESQMQVTERIVAVFPDFDQNHGILRALPMTYQDHSVSLSIGNVKDGGNAELPYTTYEQNDNLVLQIGDAGTYVHGRQEYVISYTLKNVISYYEDHDELYWDVNGDQWQQLFGSVTARIHLPSDIAPHLQDRQACYAGAYGSTEQKCDVTVAVADGVDSTEYLVTVQAEDLGPGENLSFVLGFDDGTFEQGEQVRREMLWELIKVIILVAGLIVPPLITIVVMTQRWRKYGRDPKGKGVIVPEYQRPKGMSLMAAGTLLHENLRPQAVSATLIDLAVRRYITIYEVDRKGFLQRGKKYELELARDAAGLNREEQELIRKILGADAVPGQRKSLEDLKNKLYSELGELDEMVSDELAAKLLFKASPRDVRHKHYTRAGLVIAFAMVIGFATAVSGQAFLGGLAAGVLWSGIIMLIYGKFMPARTRAGVEQRDYLKGLEAYIKLAEAERLRYLQGPEGAEVSSENKVKLFEELLPFAVLFGHEKDWAKEFGDLYKQPPEWFHGNWSTFNMVYLASSLGTFSTASSTVFSAPSGSGGSGFSGGGFSGGGGGGGGGGGW